MGAGASIDALSEKMALGVLNMERLMFNNDQLFVDDSFSSLESPEDVLGYSPATLALPTSMRIQWARASHIGAGNTIFGGRDISPMSVMPSVISSVVKIDR